ncbi:epoxide hydrolase family protein [Chitinophaga tropicalis]|uniref:Alpha/beta fold hydrolase n=1 Tax=Chitinophaga tropicalis TaxID=2683588 RepID=A0A7K1U3W5_9BACT|nr:epoxide hydrolase family protein [Chitinophaga tropicalis]MVT09054.1 alpha/beta fold hydrolase [Chitinophaga tropicalis]
MNNTISPFTISIPQEEINDLNQRLALSRFPAGKTNDWKCGAPVSYLQKIANYWQTAFNWKKQEAWLNQYPQYIASINDQPIHFLHVKSADPDAIPLMLIHGYPSSFVEFIKIIDLLTNPLPHKTKPTVSFHLIIPSIPGFGFSIPTGDESWDMIKIASVFAELMTTLGYEKFAVHGTDMGAGITGMLSAVAGHRLLGTHVNTDYTAVTGMGMLPQDLQSFSDDEKKQISAFRDYEKHETAYLKILSTKPQTLAYALTDSPIGLLSWIMEKFRTWTNASKHLPEDAIELDLLLTNISIYWFNKLGASTAYTLYDGMNMQFNWNAQSGDANAQQPAEQSWAPPKVPSGMAAFGGDGVLLKKLLGPMGNPDRWSSYDEGLHFPAMECPELLAKDIYSFFQDAVHP